MTELKITKPPSENLTSVSIFMSSHSWWTIIPGHGALLCFHCLATSRETLAPCQNFQIFGNPLLKIKFSGQFELLGIKGLLLYWKYLLFDISASSTACEYIARASGKCGSLDKLSTDSISRKKTIRFFSLQTPIPIQQSCTLLGSSTPSTQ